MCRGCLDQTVLMHSLILASAAQMGKLSIFRVMGEMIYFRPFKDAINTPFKMIKYQLYAVKEFD